MTRLSVFFWSELLDNRLWSREAHSVLLNFKTSWLTLNQIVSLLLSLFITTRILTSNLVTHFEAKTKLTVVQTVKIDLFLAKCATVTLPRFSNNVFCDDFF